MTESRALSRALDQAGDIGDDETAVVVDAHHAEIRMQGGEGIVGHLGACGGNRTDKRRFAGVRHAEQADVGQHLEFELQHALLAGRAGRALARRAVGARLEMQIA